MPPGVACENRKKINFKARYQELRRLCNKYRGMNGDKGFDCMIAASGGKDSHFQTHVMKEDMGMNPLLAGVEDNLPMTEAGIQNQKNLSEEFGCDILSMKPNIKAQKNATTGSTREPSAIFPNSWGTGNRDSGLLWRPSTTRPCL